MTDLRPPPESAHLGWHWLFNRDAEPTDCWPAQWIDGFWVYCNGVNFSPKQAADIGTRYLHPCDPAAVSINPDDARQIECVVEAAKLAVADYDDARKYSTRDSMETLRAALKALSDAC